MSAQGYVWRPPRATHGSSSSHGALNSAAFYGNTSSGGISSGGVPVSDVQAASSCFGVQIDAVHATVHPLYAFVRRWSAVLIPGVMGLASLAMALLLARMNPSSMEGTIFAGIPLPFLVCFGGMATLAITLVLIYSETIWLTTVVGGGVLLAAATLSTVGGVGLGLLVLATATAYLLFYLRLHTFRIAVGTVALTTLYGRHFRTCGPGQGLLLPGERVLTHVETSQRRFLSPTQKVWLDGPDGVAYRTSASALVSYAVEPELALRVVHEINTWERDLQISVGAILHDQLRIWGDRMLFEQEPERGALARATLHDLRALADRWGVRITWVEVRGIQLDADEAMAHSRRPRLSVNRSAARSLSARENAPTIPSQQSGVGAPVAPVASMGDLAYGFVRPHLGVQMPGVPHLPGKGKEEPQPVQRMQRMVQQPESAVPTSPLSPEALATSYEAVRERRITDPSTIRMIARAFASISADPEVSGTFPYDAGTAAHILATYADRLEHGHLRPMVTA